MGLQLWMKETLPFAAMVMIEIGEVGSVTLSKAAMNLGMNNLVLVVYYNSLGTLILLPFFIFHRHRTKLPPLNFSLLSRFSILGLLGICLLQVFGYTGIKYSSPTLAAAMANLIPVFTFLLAVIFRMEKFDIKRASSQAKSLGTIVAISGAFVMTFYVGPPIMGPTPPSNLPHNDHQSPPLKDSTWALGGLFLTLTCIWSSSWNIAQAATVKSYPDEMTVVFFYCLFGTVECAIFSLIAERNPSVWKLENGTEMIAVLYSAMFVSVFRNTVITWCLNKKGPVFVAMFKPTQMIIAVIMGLLFLGDTLHLGSVIGGITIAAGFYAVMWGQAKEKDNVAVDNGRVLESSALNAPLLQNSVTP